MGYIGAREPAYLEAGSVDNTDMAPMDQYRLKGRISSGSGAPEDLTADQGITLLNQASTQALDAARVNSYYRTLRVNGGSDLTQRLRINYLNGSGISISGADDATDGESDVTIALAAIDNNRVLGNVSGGSAAPIALNSDGLFAVINSSGTAQLANNRLAALSPSPAGTYSSANITVDAQGRVTAAANGSGGITPGSIVDADISASAAISHSKLASITAGQVLIGNGSNIPTATTLSGDVTIDASGVAAIGSGVIVNADINASAAIAGSKIQAATTSNAGAVQLTDSTSSTSTTTAATPNAVKSAYDLANAALPKAGGTLTGDVTLNAQSDLRFADSDSSNYVALQAPATVASNVTWTLPNADGTNGQVLSTNGSGTLSWTSAAGGTGDKIEEGNTSAEVIDTGSDGRFVVTTEGTERLRVDSSGRLLVGTTTDPTVGAFASARFSLKQSTDSGLGAGFQVEASGDTSVLWCGYNGTSFDFGTSYRTTGGIKPITFSVGAAERCRIDSSGRLLVGTSSARSNIYMGGASDTPKFQLEHAGNDYSGQLSLIQYTSVGYAPTYTLGISKSNTPGTNAVVASGDTLGTINFVGNDGTNFRTAAQIQANVDGTPGANDMPGRIVLSTTSDGASSPTERMRITSDGYVLFNTTNKALRDSTSGVGLSIDPAAGGLLQVAAAGPTFFNRVSSDGSIIAFRRNGVDVGSISLTGSATAYNTSSDYRLKENVTAVTDGIARLQQLKPSRFNFIADPAKTVDGFLAHEVQAVVPEAITGEKDAVDDEGNPIYQGIDQSKLVPLLTAALQEAVAEINALKDRVAALEGA